jgi:biotin carboxylase
LLGRKISAQEIPDVVENSIAWVDGYGNIKTTIPFHQRMMKDENFKAGNFHTRYLDTFNLGE